MADLLDLLEQYPCWWAAPTPSGPRPVPEQPMEQLRRFHFLDLNGRTWREEPPSSDREKTQKGGTPPPAACPPRERGKPQEKGVRDPL